MRTTVNAILLTGASSGIGHALLKRLHALGNKLLVTSRSEDSLNKLQEEFEGIQTFRCDLANGTSVGLLIDYCKKEFAELNVLINNAGVQFEYEIMAEEGRTRLEKEIRTNLISPLQLVQELAPVLKQNSPAAIVNVTSALAITPKRSAPVYCGTKSALRTYGRALSYQLQDSGIALFEIIPPLVDTAMTKGRGKGKISPEQLADEFIRSFSRDRTEIYIGKAKLLRLIHRILPGVAEKMLRDS